MAMTSEPFRWTATEVLRAYDAGTLTVEEYCSSLLKRIADRDAAVKAWVHLDPDQVYQQARRLDAVPKAQRGPLHGVAVGVKDVIYTKGMPTQHHSPFYKDDQPEVDAGSVMILKQAGALILGKTTTTEFAATTAGPKTNNPFDLERTPGGSSSGSGAAVGDLHVPIALGTQTGGSVLRPGSYNGIYAMKPTWNAITREGQKVYSLILDTLGFYGRSVDDLRLLSRIFRLSDDAQPAAFPDGVRGLKFGFCKTMLWPDVGPGTLAAFQKGRELLEAAGATVEDLDFPVGFSNLFEWHTIVLFSDGRSAFLPDYVNGKELLHPSLQAHVEEKHGYTRAQYLEAFDGIAALRPRWDAICSEYAAVVAPSVSDIAPKIPDLEGGEHRDTGNAAFQSIWTALHVPLINVPGFAGEDGMPIGLTLVAPRYKDQALIEVAAAVGPVWEKQGGWVRPVL